MNASNAVVEVGRGGDDGRGEQDVSPLNLACRPGRGGGIAQVPDYYKGDDPIAIVYKGPTFVNSHVMAL